MTVVGGKKYQQGIEGYTIVQAGRATKSLDEAVEEAKEMHGWVEEDGVPTYRPTGQIKRTGQ